MITSISLNPSIDLTLFISNLVKGGSHRASNTRRDISGKAVNTAYALKNLNIPCQLVGFDFIENGSLLKEALHEAGIFYDSVAAEGAMRTNVKIFEEESRQMTEINQNGPTVPKEAVRALLEKIKNTQTDVLILSGSLPPGVDTGTYGEIIKQAKAPVILDAFGPALYEGLKEKPYIIKPNLKEMEQTFNVSLPSKNDKLSAARNLLHKYDGLKAVCLSMGAEGAMIIGKEEAYFSPALDIPVRGIQGAGDSMVAGLAAELYKNHNAPLKDLLRSAMACAAASLIQEGTLMAKQDDFNEMIKKVEIVEV